MPFRFPSTEELPQPVQEASRGRLAALWIPAPTRSTGRRVQLRKVYGGTLLERAIPHSVSSLLRTKSSSLTGIRQRGGLSRPFLLDQEPRPKFHAGQPLLRPCQPLSHQ